MLGDCGRAEMTSYELWKGMGEAEGHKQKYWRKRLGSQEAAGTCQVEASCRQGGRRPLLFLLVHGTIYCSLQLCVFLQQAVVLLGEALRLLPHGQNLVFSFL